MGFCLPARMSVLPLNEHELALVSPVPFGDGCAEALAEQGEVTHIIAPNLWHHRYLDYAIRRYPDAVLWGPAGLAKKRPELRLDASLEEVAEEALGPDVRILPIEGIPALSEFAFFHQPSRTLVLTDLVFHMLQPEGFVAKLILTLMGTRGRLAVSRALRLLIKDRPAVTASVERLLELPIETVVMAHGEILRDRAVQALGAALAPLGAAPLALPAAL
jgi:hypothetical protein